jgi:hypothetical protein
MTVETALVTVGVAAISFLAAVVAVVVGQLLGQKYTREADLRRWKRDDAVRRRTRSEEMARQAMDQVLLAADLLSGEAFRQRAKVDPAEVDEVATFKIRRREFIGPSEAVLRPVLDRLRRYRLEIDDSAVRLCLDRCADVLGNYNNLHYFGGPEPDDVGWRARRAAEGVVGAFLRGEPIPADDDGLDEAHGALEALWDEVADDDE